MIRVLIADDHKLIREGYRALLKGENDIQVVGEARDGLEALELIQQLNPDILLLDVAMPRVDGLTTLKRLKELPSKPFVLLCTMYADGAIVRQAIADGAQGFISKNADFPQLITAIRTLYLGKTYYGPSFAKFAPPLGTLDEPQLPVHD